MKKLFTLMKTLLVAVGLCVGMSAWADATLFTAPTDNGDGTYSLNGSTYTKTTYSFTSEPSKGSAKSKETASVKPSGYTDDATNRYKMTLSSSTSVSDMLSGVTFTNTSGSEKIVYFCSSYGLQADDGGYVKLSITGQSERTLAVLHYTTGDGTTTVAGGTTHTIAKKGANISFALGNKNASPYYLYTSLDVYEETKIGDFTYDSTTGYYTKSDGLYQRTTYDFSTATLGASTDGSTVAGFTNTGVTRYKTGTLSQNSAQATLIDGVTFTVGGTATNMYGCIGYGVQTDKSVTAKPTTMDANTTAYFYYKQGDNAKLVEEVAEQYTTQSGTSISFSMSSKNSPDYYLYTGMVVFQKVADRIGDFYAGGNGFYYQLNDFDAMSTPYARTTYNFSSYTYGAAKDTKTGTEYNPSGFTDSSSNTRYQTTISNGKSNSSVPSGLTIANNGGSNAYLQYYKNMGMQAGTGALTISVTNAAASTVSYLYYKQGASPATASVAETPESTPITINGTASTAIELKTSSYKLYTRLEVFTREVKATTGTNGYATFSSAYPLALGSMTASEGVVTAYYAKSVGEGKVTLTSIEDNVEAGEGLILKGTAGATITIPVAASGDAIDNYLVGCPIETPLTANANYYVLVNNSGTPEFQCLDTNGATIPAGKAYLNISGTNARSLSISFDDDNTTSISTIANSQQLTANSYYDLQGRCVAQPTKGLYIKNGKKVVIK